MPHMCTRCSSVFEDGMDVLEGCPVCGWNKFLFVKSKDNIKDARSALEASQIGRAGEPRREGDDSLRNNQKKSPSQDPKTGRPGGGRKGRAVRKDKPVLKEKPNKRGKGTLGFFDLDPKKESPQTPQDRGSQRHRIGEDETLESIRMPEPGRYELNLASLFEREELVMAIKDGTYLIDLSSAFKKSKKS